MQTVPGSAAPTANLQMVTLLTRVHWNVSKERINQEFASIFQSTYKKAVFKARTQPWPLPISPLALSLPLSLSLSLSFFSPYVCLSVSLSAYASLSPCVSTSASCVSTTC